MSTTNEHNLPVFTTQHNPDKFSRSLDSKGQCHRAPTSSRARRGQQATSPSRYGHIPSSHAVPRRRVIAGASWKRQRALPVKTKEQRRAGLRMMLIHSLNHGSFVAFLIICQYHIVTFQ